MRAEVPAAGAHPGGILPPGFEWLSHDSAHIIALPPIRAKHGNQAVLTQADSERTAFRVVAVLALMGVLVLSFLPSASVDPLRPNIGDTLDIAHVVAYALLAASTILSLPGQTLTFRQGAAVVLAISLLGIAIELLQPMAGRTASVVDFTENEIGIAGGIALFRAYRHVQRVRARDGGRQVATPRRTCRRTQEKC